MKNLFKRLLHRVTKFRVRRVMRKHKDKEQKMVFDDDKNLYGEKVRDAGFGAKLNVAFYVVVGKKIYGVALFHNFSHRYFINDYSRSVFNHKPEDIKEYDGLTSSESMMESFATITMLRSLIRNRMERTARHNNDTTDR